MQCVGPMSKQQMLRENQMVKWYARPYPMSWNLSRIMEQQDATHITMSGAWPSAPCNYLGYLFMVLFISCCLCPKLILNVLKLVFLGWIYILLMNTHFK